MLVHISCYKKSWVIPYKILSWVSGLFSNYGEKSYRYYIKKYIDSIIDRNTDASFRNITVKVSDDDVINLDMTLAYVIYPSLIKFKEISINNSVVPWTDESDYPSIPDNLEIHQNGRSHERWQAILDDIIFAFSLKVGVDNPESYVYNEYQQHAIQRGLMLFGKYYGCLTL